MSLDPIRLVHSFRAKAGQGYTNNHYVGQIYVLLHSVSALTSMDDGLITSAVAEHVHTTSESHHKLEGCRSSRLPKETA